MLKYFRVKREPEKVVSDLSAISVSLLESDAAVDAHIAGREQYDDITLLGVHRKE